MLMLAEARQGSLAEIVSALQEGKPIEDLLVGVARYAESLRMSAEAELNGLRHNLQELQSIKQHMDSGLVIPGSMPMPNSPLITSR